MLTLAVWSAETVPTTGSPSLLTATSHTPSLCPVYLHMHRRLNQGGRAQHDFSLAWLEAAWAGIFKPLWRPGIDAKASIPPAYVAWRAGTITLFLLGA